MCPMKLCRIAPREIRVSLPWVQAVRHADSSCDRRTSPEAEYCTHKWFPRSTTSSRGMAAPPSTCIRRGAKCTSHRRSANGPSTASTRNSYQIGAAYFLKYQLYRNFDDLWTYHLDGLLREYLRGTPYIEDKMKRLREAYNDTTH